MITDAFLKTIKILEKETKEIIMEEESERSAFKMAVEMAIRIEDSDLFHALLDYGFSYEDTLSIISGLKNAKKKGI